MRKLMIVAGLLSLMLVIPASASVSNEVVEIEVEGIQCYDYAYEVIDQINALRSGVGVKELKVDEKLMSVAMQRAAECSVYYSHTRPNNTDCITLIPTASIRGENIAAWDVSPTAVMNSWTNSQGHYENMIHPSFTKVGVGCFNVDGVYYWAQVFSSGSAKNHSELPDTEAVVPVEIVHKLVALDKDSDPAILSVGETVRLPLSVINTQVFNSPTPVKAASASITFPDFVELDLDEFTLTGNCVGFGEITVKLENGDTTVIECLVPAAFEDVPDYQYFAGPVAWATNVGITNGTTPTAFSPGAQCTQAHIITFISRAVEGKNTSGTNPYSNPSITSDAFSYAYDPFIWAYNTGVVTNTAIDPAAGCSRSDVVLYLWRLAGKPSATSSTSFTDVPLDAPYAQAVSWAVSEGITTGTSSYTFSPDLICSRGEIVTFLYRSLA